MRNEHLVDPNQAPEDAPPTGPYGELVALARNAASPETFLRKALSHIADAFSSPYAVIYARYASTVVQESCHRGESNPKFWKNAVEQFLTESLAEGRSRARLLSARNAELRIALLSAPLFGPQGEPLGAIALVTPIQEVDARRAASFLESLAAFTSTVAGQLRSGGAKPGAGQVDSAKSASALARAASFQSLAELAYSLTNNLRNKIGAAQVALGLVRRRRVSILAISGLDEVRNQSPGIVPLRAAMEECLDHGDVIVAQRDGGFTAGGEPARFRLHGAWHDTAGGAAVASIPLMLDDRCLAILSLRRSGDEPFSQEDIERVTQMVTPFAPAIALVREAKRSIREHVRERCTSTARAAVTPGRWGTKIFASVLLAAVAWFCFGTLPYEIVVPAKLTPSTVRHIAAPSEAVLQAAPPLPGDRIAAGQLLCRFDDSDLALEQASLEAELAVAHKQAQQARADDDPVAARLAHASASLVQTRLEIVRNKRARLTIHSPIAGVVIDGDQRTKLGAVVEQGAPLFQIAPLDNWTLELSAPQHTASELIAGKPGRFVPNACPERATAFTVARLRPQAEQRAQQTVFVVEADVALGDLPLQPGMEGMAKVELGRRPVWWLALHRAIDYLQLNFWL